MKPKILLVHNYYKIPGGEDTVVQNEKKLLEDNGHTVVCYFRNNNEMNQYNIWQKMLLPFISIFSIKTYKEVKKIIKEEGIELVHVHNTLSLVSPSVFYAAFHTKVPIVQTLHNFRLLCPGALFYRDGHICEECVSRGLACAVKHKCYRNSYAQSAVSAMILGIHRCLGTYRRIHFICLTEFNRNLIMSSKKIISSNQTKSEGKIYIKPNFTSGSYVRTPYEKRKNQYVYIGRLETVKGIKLVLEAFRDIKDSRLVVCGTGPLDQWCRNFIEENQMDHVILKGQTNHSEVMEVLSDSKALIFASQLYEGLPMSILESYSVGTPVIGCDIGNGGALILDAQCKIRMGYPFTEELVRCMKYLATEGFSGAEDATQYYSENTAYQKIEAIYMDILGRTKRQ